MKNRIIDFYRFAPLNVMAVHERDPEFDGLLCPFLQLSEKAFGYEKSLDTVKGTALLFSGRMGFWLGAGFVGFVGTTGVLLGGTALGPAALLTFATTIMTGLTLVELYHRVDLAARKSAEILRLKQNISSGGSKGDRAHTVGYLEDVLEKEVATSRFIFLYETATMAASLGLAKVLVRMIPKNYSSPEQIGKLVLQASHSKPAQKTLHKIFGTHDYVKIVKAWPSLTPAAQAEAILLMRSELYFQRYVFHPYFLKEMYDAWHFYPNILDFPGNAKISCGPEQVFFRDARCHAYCESMDDPQSAERCRDL